MSIVARYFLHCAVFFVFLSTVVRENLSKTRQAGSIYICCIDWLTLILIPDLGPRYADQKASSAVALTFNFTEGHTNSNEDQYADLKTSSAVVSTFNFSEGHTNSNEDQIWLVKKGEYIGGGVVCIVGPSY